MGAIQHLSEANERARAERMDDRRRSSLGLSHDSTDARDKDEAKEGDMKQTTEASSSD